MYMENEQANKIAEEIKKISGTILGKFITDHQELYDHITQIFYTETLLEKDDLRYMFLASLISSDNIVDVESAETSLKHIKFIKDNLQYMHLSDEIKKETLKYVNKGIRIINKDLKEFKKNENN